MHDVRREHDRHLRVLIERMERQGYPESAIHDAVRRAARSTRGATHRSERRRLRLPFRRRGGTQEA